MDAMPPESRPSVLRRMAGAAPGSGTVASRAEAPTLERAFATAILRVADGLSGLGLSTGVRVTRRLGRAAAFDGFDERVLCLLLDPSDHDPLTPAAAAEGIAARTGLVVLDPGLTDALVEVQTIGRVAGPARPPRRPTRIDAALTQPFVRAVLDQMLRQIEPGSVEPRPGALRTGSFIAGPASLGLILTAPEFLRLDLELRLGDGARACGLTLLLPISAGPRPEQDNPASPERPWAQAMHDAAMGAPVRLEAVLPPMRLPLSRMMSLKVGDLIPLDPSALAEITLHSGASGVTVPGRKRLPGRATLKARLGQLNGLRAVKISTLPHEARHGAIAPGDDGSFGAAALFGTDGTEEPVPTGTTQLAVPESQAETGRAIH